MFELHGRSIIAGEAVGDKLIERAHEETALPVELRDENERGIWRLVNNRWSKNIELVARYGAASSR